jgi:hypothetical protein
VGAPGKHLEECEHPLVRDPETTALRVTISCRDHLNDIVIVVVSSLILMANFQTFHVQILPNRCWPCTWQSSQFADQPKDTNSVGIFDLIGHRG